MDPLSIVSDSRDRAGDIGRQLAGMFETQSYACRTLPRAKPAKYTIVDIDLAESSHLTDLRLWLMHKPIGGRVIFAVGRGIRREAVQAYAVGATDVLERPFDRKTLLTMLLGDIGSLDGDSLDLSISNSEGILAGVGALRALFDSLISGRPVELGGVHAAGEALVSNIEAEGLAHWMDVVRRHHSQTYQHCLLVTGVAVGFGRHLGFSSSDTQRLAFAGLLHDIGKAGVPVAILEKSSPLDEHETAIMMRHPQLGFDALRGMQGLDPDMLDMVVHHHEYLDGSGYPHGLRAGELSDLVRIMTIADIFGALIERRAYRAPMTYKAAFQVLENMGTRLDKDLVRAFESFVRTQTM